MQGRRRRVWLTIAIVAGLVTGCSAAASGDKSGARQDSVQLVLANNDGDLSGVPALRQFLKRLRERSAGKVTVTVRSRWKGGNDEPRVVRDVAAGEADLGWAGTRAFDRVGVAAFRPLHAPFLVSSYAAESAVVTDAGLTKQLLGSLAPAGVTGLALMADELRHVAGTAHPLLAPEDFSGLTFVTLDSGAQVDGIAALGAHPSTATVRGTANADRLGGFETMWWTYATQHFATFAPYVSANVNLWPRTWVLFANPAALRGLGAEARGWVIGAASDAAAWSAAHAADREAGEIALACTDGARVATATTAQLAALRDAAEPVYARLRSDAALRGTLERIEQLVAGSPADPPSVVPPGCRYRPGDEDTSSTVLLTAPGASGRLPAGTYRYRLTVHGLEQQGLPTNDALANAGVWTWKIGNGSWSYTQEPVSNAATMTSCEGFYDVRGGLASFTTTKLYASGDCAPRTWTARWTAGDKRLAWSRISVADFVPVFAPGPWLKLD